MVFNPYFPNSPLDILGFPEEQKLPSSVFVKRHLPITWITVDRK